MGLTHFRVATFNLYNLVLPNVTYYDDRHYTPELYNRKKTWIASQLAQMQADVIGFQEVFQEEALHDVLAESRLYDRAKMLVAQPIAVESAQESGRGSSDGPRVGLVSRLPILSHQWFETFPPQTRLDIDAPDLDLDRFTRPVLAARLALNDRIECTVLVVHLKSKRPLLSEKADPNDPIDRAKGQVRALLVRAAEATALRAIVTDLIQQTQHPVIVLGDFNDTGLAVTSQIVAGDPPWEDMDFQQKQKIWDVLLYNVKDIQARQSYSDHHYTQIHQGHYQSIDHILVSQEFVAQNPRRIGKVSYVSVFNDHLIDETLSPDSIAPWQSDHGQVVATIELA